MSTYTLRLEWIDGHVSGGKVFTRKREVLSWAKKFREVALMCRVVVLKDGVEIEG